MVNDYTECHIYDDGGAHYCLVGIYKEKYILNNDDIGVPIVVDIGYLKRSRIEIVRRLGGYYIEYRNPIKFILYKWTFLNTIPTYFKILDRFVFHLFGKNPPKRMEILEYLIEVNEYSYTSKFTVFGILMGIYGININLHRDVRRINVKINYYVQSFVDSGEIHHLDSYNYSLTPKALVTYENYKMDVNRQRLGIFYNIILLILTLVVAAESAIEVYKFLK